MRHRLAVRGVRVDGGVFAGGRGWLQRLGLVALALLIHALSIALAHAQSAQLSGYVVDQSDARIEGATVVVTNSDTAQVRETKTSAAGQYVMAGMANGRYRVVVTAPGFVSVTRAILIDVAQAARLDVTLKVGDVAETVMVSLEARPLESTDGAVSTVIDRRFITSLPLNGRSLQSLIGLVPGVVAVPAGPGSSGQFSVNGQRADANGFSVDGVSATVSATGGGFGEDYSGNHPTLSAAGTTSNLVSLDALQEFRVQTSSFAPEFGRTPGAQVQLITRSGANTLTGAGSYYFRHDAMDANDWFANRASLPQPRLRHHDVGGVLGGPLRRDRLFYFVSHESLSQMLPQTTTGLVPSLALRASAAPALRGVLNAFPLPNGPDAVDRDGVLTGLADFTSNHSDTTTTHSTGVRVDMTLGSGSTLFTRAQFAPSSAVRRQGASSWLQTIEQDALTVTPGLNTTLGSRTALELRANYSRSTYDLSQDVDTWGGASPIDRSYFFPQGAGNTLGDFYLYLGGSLRRLMLGDSLQNRQQQLNVVASASHARGSHLLKTGVDYRRLTPTFDGAAYQLQTLVVSMADALNGRAYVYRATTRNPHPVFENVSLFGQDTWAVSSRLTLTYGVRWDINPAFSVRDGEYPLVLRVDDGSGALSVAPRGTPLYETEFGNVAPRVGVSVRVRDRERWGTLVRGGGGLFYDLASRGAEFIGYPSFLREVSGPVALPLTAAMVPALQPPADAYVPPFSSLVSGYASGFESGRAWQWNLGVVQELADVQSIALTYVGASNAHLIRRQRLESPPDFSDALLSFSDANASYHGLSAQFTRRMSKGLQALASYTWSHAIDETSTLLTESIERGSAEFDVRQAGSVAVAWELPRPRGPKALVAALGGWAVDGTARWRTGLPVDVLTGQSFVAGELLASRPDRLSGVALYVDDAAAPGGRRFNTAPSATRDGCLGAVCEPLGNTGDLGRNVFRGPGAWQVDLALRRTVSVRGARVTLGAEIFNVFNHPNFGQPDGSFGSSNYGRSVSMLNRSLGGLDPLYQIGGPRSVQLGAKVVF
jgi:hypothetical protein